VACAADLEQQEGLLLFHVREGLQRARLAPMAGSAGPGRLQATRPNHGATRQEPLQDACQLQAHGQDDQGGELKLSPWS